MANIVIIFKEGLIIMIAHGKKIKIFTGKNTKRVMSKLRKKAEARGASCDSLTDDRMGVMSKKMIENAEHSMK